MLGIFDSGFGGLSVLRALREALPEHSMMYLGDSARTPYGNRSRETVTKYTKECCTQLFDRGCNLIILACNTASADTLRELQQEWLPSLNESGVPPRNIIGVLRPLAEEASERSKTGRIAVVGTRGTVSSGAYVSELQKLRSDVDVTQQACPLLVPFVEEGWIDRVETRRILRYYLQSVKTKNPDVLILGCTHYEVLHDLFAAKMGKRCTVLHSPSIVAEKLADYLQRHPEYDEQIPKKGETIFLTTGDEERFREVGKLFYREELPEVERVEV